MYGVTEVTYSILSATVLYHFYDRVEPVSVLSLRGSTLTSMLHVLRLSKILGEPSYRTCSWYVSVVRVGMRAT